MSLNVQKTFESSAGFAALARSALKTGQSLNLLVLSPSTENAVGDAISRIHSDDDDSALQRPQLTLTYLGNRLPWVSAGRAIATLVNSTTSLNGLASNTTSTSWRKLSGPGAVTFGSASQLGTTASFSQPGNYMLRLSASNSLGQVSRDVTVAVASAAPIMTSAALTNGLLSFRVHCTTGLNVSVRLSHLFGGSAEWQSGVHETQTPPVL